MPVFQRLRWLITQQIGIEHAYPVLIELKGDVATACDHRDTVTTLPQRYINGSVLWGYFDPVQPARRAFANLAFKAPVCREIIACLCYSGGK